MKKGILTVTGCSLWIAVTVFAQTDQTVPPSLRVVCTPLVATVRLDGNMPSGEQSVLLEGNPVTLKKGERYTLFVTKPGYNSYRVSFDAVWSGRREKSVVLERGIGPAEGDVWIADLEDSRRIEFVPIPAGSFLMGSEFGEEDERPVHRVEFKRPFWLAKTELTNEQFEQYLQFKNLYTEQPSATPTVEEQKNLEKNEIAMPQGADYPLVYINWNDALEFCEWLTKKERRRGRLPEGYIYTLPTEAEWEYACRAGTEGDYAGRVNDMGWHKGNSSPRINAVGQKKPNAWGLYDMHGNVWEWCIDEWYATYVHAPVNGSQRGDALNEYGVDQSRIDEPGNRIRLHNPDYRVVRGGSWSYPAAACRSANRYYHRPDFELNYLGFRPVLVWNPPVTQIRATRMLPDDSKESR
jgi:formylglycine-generating enzyme required for sulfatase activity